MTRRCRPVFVEQNLRLRIGARLRAAWHAWKASGLCPAGEATWDSREWLVSICRDGRLELVEKTGRERYALLSPGGSRFMIYEGRTRPDRPMPHRRDCHVEHVGSVR